MRAEIIHTLMVAWDGVHAESVEAGTVLEGERAAHAVEQGFGRELGEKAKPDPLNKAVAAAPRNKAR